MGLCNISIALFFCFEIILLIISLNLENKKFLMTVLLILISFAYANKIKNIYNNVFDFTEECYILRIESLNEKTKNYNKYIAKVKSGKYKNFRIYIYSKQEFDYGAMIQCFDKIDKPESVRNHKRF